MELVELLVARLESAGVLGRNGVILEDSAAAAAVPAFAFAGAAFCLDEGAFAFALVGLFTVVLAFLAVALAAFLVFFGVTFATLFWTGAFVFLAFDFGGEAIFLAGLEAFLAGAFFLAGIFFFDGAFVLDGAFFFGAAFFLAGAFFFGAAFFLAGAFFFVAARAAAFTGAFFFPTEAFEADLLPDFFVAFEVEALPVALGAALLDFALEAFFLLFVAICPPVVRPCRPSWRLRTAHYQGHDALAEHNLSRKAR